MFAIATSEFVQLFRNRLVLISSFVMPIAVSAFFISRHETFSEIGSGIGYIAAVLVMTVGVFGLYSAAVTTLAARRQNLFLKRLRSTAAGDAGILTGLVLPATVLALIQAAVIVVVLAVVAGAPVDIVMIVVAIVVVMAMLLGFALATAGVTNSPEHAQVTTLPVIFAFIGIATWVGITGTEELTMLKRLLPGGAATELITTSWAGGTELSEQLLLLAPTAAWVLVAVTLGARMFRWEPRR